VPLTYSSSTTFILLLPDNTHEYLLVLENLGSLLQMEGSEGLLYQKHKEEAWTVDVWRRVSENESERFAIPDMRLCIL
jgi:hypothetical protein